MDKLIIAPPIAFFLFIAIFMTFSKVLSRCSRQGIRRERDLDPYACGQRDVQHYVNPDYSEFFPYAFFFTIMHVLALVIATAPYDALLLPVLFIAFGILCLVIIFKR